MADKRIDQLPSVTPDGSEYLILQKTDDFSYAKTTVDEVQNANIPDATDAVKGKVQLAGDLAGVNSSAAAPTVKYLARVFNVKDFGAVGDGTTDNTTAINDAIAAAAVIGGSVYIPYSTSPYKCLGALHIPFGGTYTKPTQMPIRIYGDGPNWNGYWTGTFVNSGSILDLRYDGGDGLYAGKIDTRGGGYLEIDHLSLVSGGSDDFRFIFCTNTTMSIHDVGFQGNPSKSALNCMQDAVQFGGICTGTVSQSGNTITGVGTAFIPDIVGSTLVYDEEAGTTKALITGYVSPTELTTSISQTITSQAYGFLPGRTHLNPFQGYGTHMRRNYYSRIRRGVTFGNYTNDITIERETYSTSCGDATVDTATGDPIGAPYWFEPSFSSVGGNRIKESTIEAGSYAYGVTFTGTGFSYSNKIDHIGIYDDHGNTYGAVWAGEGAYYNLIFAGWLNTSLQDTYINGPNKIYQRLVSASQNAMDYSYVGVQSRNIVTRDITTVYADLPLGQSMTINTGTGGSNLSLIANAILNKDRDGNTLSQFKNSASAKGVLQLAQGTTAGRPSASSVGAGSIWFDTTLGKQIISDGSSWLVVPDDSKMVHNTGDTITIPDGGNAAALTLRQNDVTNNPKGMLIVQAAANIGLDISQQNNGQGLRITHNDSTSGGSLAAIDVIRTADSSSLVRGISVSATNAGAGGVRALDVVGGAKIDALGVGVNTPTATLHIKSGSASANTAPIKINSGTLLATPEAGTIEFDGSHFYVTAGSTRYQVDRQGSTSSGAFTPADIGLLATNFDPVIIDGTSVPLATNGTVVVLKLRTDTALTVNNIVMSVITAGATLTAGENFAAVYDSSKNLLAATADQTTAWQSTGTKTMALSSAQSIGIGYFYVALWSNGTTRPAFACASSNGAVNGLLTTANSRFATADTSITTTAPSTLGTFTAATVSYWAGVS